MMCYNHPIMASYTKLINTSLSQGTTDPRMYISNFIESFIKATNLSARKQDYIVGDLVII